MRLRYVENVAEVWPFFVRPGIEDALRKLGPVDTPEAILVALGQRKAGLFLIYAGDHIPGFTVVEQREDCLFVRCLWMRRGWAKRYRAELTAEMKRLAEGLPLRWDERSRKGWSRITL